MKSAEKETASKGKAAAAGEAGYTSRAIALGMNMAAGMAVFTLLGYWIDRKLGGDGGGSWMLVGMFAGLAYGGYEVWKLVRRTGADDRTRVDGQADGGERR